MKNKFKRSLSLAIVSMFLLFLLPITAHAEWKQNNTGWWYAENNNWATNWRLINGKWYYFYSNGYMAHDTAINGYNVNSSGEWIQTLPTIINNTNNNITKQDTKKVNENNYTYNNKDYNIKSKDNTKTSSSTSSTSNDYYDYSSKGSNETWVSGYYRKGKYVSGHYRTKKDSTTSNNYSHKGNTNPHNRKRGYNK